jgi:ADP-ribosylglycohydrolase
MSTKSALEKWSTELEARYNHLPPDSVEAEEAFRAIEKQISDTFSEDKFCGNGSLMRVLPAALIARSEPEAVELARQSSLTTHPHLRCVHACMIYASIVYQALNGASKTELAVSLGETINDDAGNVTDYPLEPVLKERLQRYRALGDWEATAQQEIRSTGYVVDSLEASLWAFFKTNSFEEGATLAVNLGDDTDTVGAIYGGLAGAFYGIDAVPEQWRQELKRSDLVEEAVEKILAFREHTV